MAKLKCNHGRRVLVFKHAGELPKTLHRNDGSRCNSEFVSIDKVVYQPSISTAFLAIATNVKALGPVVGIGKVDDIAEKIAKAKTRRAVKKHVKK